MSRERVQVFDEALLPPLPLELAALRAAAGECVSGAGTDTEVYRLSAGGRDYYLKLALRQRSRVLLPRMLAARRRCSSAELEAHILAELQHRGFNTIPLVAAGSAYRGGLPVAGFMLSLAVAAPTLEGVLKAGVEGSEELWRDYGALTARLHRCGCLEPLRAKDLLVSEGRLQLLDREKPLTAAASERRRLRVLQRAMARNRRSGLRPGETPLAAFAAGYDSIGPALGEELLAVLA